ncbi:Sorting nexin, cytoplasm-to-vacuole targeting pathway/endosomal sorting [Phlyctochytrium planicorne]|nr:Sorting nexin, cytoplasm-to-vacuole targeting pathway/endosomal sorting [Phlyctochytrium planicorne]
MSNPLEDPNFTTTPPPPLPEFSSPFASSSALNGSGGGRLGGGGFSSDVLENPFTSKTAAPGLSASNLERSYFDDSRDEDGGNTSGASAAGAASGDEESNKSEGQQGKVDFSVPIDERLNPYSKLDSRPCCNTDRVLRGVNPLVFNPLVTSEPLDQQDRPAITITDASKTSEGSGSYIAYIIRTDIPSVGIHLESKHRYSDFESLQRLLRKAHPTIVVPPVPEKHTVADYAARPGKAKDDPRIIEGRKRQLQTFLNRVAAHPILGKEHVFHRFIDGAGGSWTDILMDSGLAHYLKKKEANTGIKLTDTLLKNPDPHFLASEDYTYRFGVQLGNVVKYHKRIVKHHSEAASVGSDLGAAYNGWSLTEMGPSGHLSHPIEAVGEAVDKTVAATSQMVLWLEDRVSDPLTDYEKLTKSIEKILRWRHNKHVHFETTSENLVVKKATLAKLENSELESQRLQAVLHAEGTSGPATARAIAAQSNNPYGRSSAAGGGGEAENSGSGFSGVTSSSTLSSAYTGRSSSSGGGGIFATLNSFIDNDPEATRRSNITKTRDRIAGLEQERKQSLAELGASNESIQRDLDRFQRDKVHDLRNVLLAYAVAHREMCRKSLAAWKDAKQAIESVDTSR